MFVFLKKHFLELISFAVCFFYPIKPLIISVVVLGLFDFITGVTAAYKYGGWKSISSKKMYHSVVKVTLYSILIAVSFIIEKFMIDYLPLVKLATSCIALVELKSLYENTSSILGIDLWKYMKLAFEKKIDSDHKP